MALIKFELKKEHLILLKFLNWEIISRERLATSIEDGSVTPFGGIDLTEDIGLILYGKPEGEFDPTESTIVVYSDEQKREMELIYSELPMALEIILLLQTFELGEYKRKWNLKNWRKS